MVYCSIMTRCYTKFFCELLSIVKRLKEKRLKNKLMNINCFRSFYYFLVLFFPVTRQLSVEAKIKMPKVTKIIQNRVQCALWHAFLNAIKKSLIKHPCFLSMLCLWPSEAKRGPVSTSPLLFGVWYVLKRLTFYLTQSQQRIQSHRYIKKNTPHVKIRAKILVLHSAGVQR